MTELPPLEPELASELISRHGPEAVRIIRRAPLAATDSATGAMLERIVVPSDRDVHYVVKRVTPLGDWLARATNDRLMRECTLAAAGVFDGFPQGVSSATVAAVRTSAGAAILMRDVSAGLIASGDARFTEEQLRVVLNGLARMHAQLAGFPLRRADDLGLNTLEAWLTPLAPKTARREADREPRDAVTPHILPGWRAFADLEPDAWRLIEPLLDDPRPVANALRRFVPTLVHGDAKAANFAIEDESVAFLDWSTTTAGPGALDLAWFLCINAARLPGTKDAAIENYRAERAHLGVLPAHGDAWEQELAVSMMTSSMRLGWMRALEASSPTGDTSRRGWSRAEVRYWAQRALEARWLIGDQQGC